MIEFVKQAMIEGKFQHFELERKYTGEPYFVHLQNVANKVKEWGYPELQAIAYLHDIVEDTTYTIEQVEKAFNKEIATNVWFLTDVPLIAGNRKTRNHLNNLRLSQAPESALIVKCADMIDNMKDIVEHDKKFAKVYLMEIWSRLSFLMMNVPEKIYNELIREFYVQEKKIMKDFLNENSKTV